MPRLLQNSRRTRPPPASGASGASTATSAHNGPVELPPYEAPSFPMNDTAKRALLEISNNRDTRKYEQHLTKSIALLRDSVGVTNDRLRFRTDHVEQFQARRTERGEDQKSAVEIATEECAEKLGDEVPALTSRAEAALREVIDYRAELEDERAVLDEVYNQVRAQLPRQPRPEKRRKVQRVGPGSDGDDDDADDNAEAQAEEEDAEMEDPEDKIPFTGASELLESIRQSKASEYGNLSMYERYGLNNDYISFKRTLHDALYQDDVPLPDASTWFGPDGRPAVDTINSRNKSAKKESGEGEEDLVIEREVLSFRCPLTLQTMTEPYTSRVCKHTFEKAAILVFIRDNRGKCKCPVCPSEIQAKDLFLDEIMQRKIQRSQKAAKENVDRTSDVEPDDDDGDESVCVGRSTQVKRERGRRRRVVDDVEDEEDEEGEEGEDGEEDEEDEEEA